MKKVAVDIYHPTAGVWNIPAFEGSADEIQKSIITVENAGVGTMTFGCGKSRLILPCVVLRTCIFRLTETDEEA